jgi:hypothetical protein
MKYLKVMLLTAVAVCAFGAASAQAALPEFAGTFPTTFTSASTSPVFESSGGSLKITCAKSKGTGEITGAKAASFKELFESCKATIFGIPIATCTGAGQASGNIAAEGSNTLGFRLGGLVPLVALTIVQIHITCGSNLVLVKGCLLGTTTLAKSTTATLKFEGSKGANTDVDYTNDAKATVACKLESELNAEGFKQSDQVQTATLTLSKEIEVKD